MGLAGSHCQLSAYQLQDKEECWNSRVLRTFFYEEKKFFFSQFYLKRDFEESSELYDAAVSINYHPNHKKISKF